LKPGTKALNKHYDIIMVHGHVNWGACIFDMQKYDRIKAVLYQYFNTCTSLHCTVCVQNEIVRTVNVHATTLLIIPNKIAMYYNHFSPHNVDIKTCSNALLNCNSWQ